MEHSFRNIPNVKWPTPEYYSNFWLNYIGSGLVNPYAHMGRREKRKKHDSLPGGNSLTRLKRADPITYFEGQGAASTNPLHIFFIKMF